VDVDAFDAHLRRAEALEGLEALAEYERALSLYQSDFLGNEPYEWAEGAVCESVD
jgi:two-component SAPR family response regulator